MQYSIAEHELVSFDSTRPWPFFTVNDKDSPRIRNIKRHVRYNDYFGTVAAVLNLTRYVSGEIERCTKQINQVNRKNIKRLEKLRDDLVYLQKEYRIMKKLQNKKEKSS